MAEGFTVKIRFPSDDTETETIWAQELGIGRYRLDNVPWFAYGISLGDVVAAIPDADGGLRFSTVIAKSGNRTLRVILAESPPAATLTFESQRVLPMLETLGCVWEGADGRWIAVNVPPHIDLEAITVALDGTDVRWEYADPTPEAMGVGASHEDE